MVEESKRLEPGEERALHAINHFISCLKVHLVNGTAHNEHVREALIELSILLGNIPYWIAEGRGKDFHDLILSNLQAAEPALGLIAVDDYPEPPEGEDLSQVLLIEPDEYPIPVGVFNRRSE
ncbi:MAG: hypothetical protein M0P59_03425 [Gallionella sp.]|jgi:hypothetical protein|nr:hypothetical protein [Gallionella sp.]MCK9353190.1 hypothetical protein [Gallionella sp.]